MNIFFILKYSKLFHWQQVKLAGASYTPCDRCENFQRCDRWGLKNIEHAFTLSITIVSEAVVDFGGETLLLTMLSGTVVDCGGDNLLFALSLMVLANHAFTLSLTIGSEAVVDFGGDTMSLTMVPGTVVDCGGDTLLFALSLMVLAILSSAFLVTAIAQATIFFFKNEFQARNNYYNRFMAAIF